MTEAIEPNEQPEDEATEMAEVLPFPSQHQGDEDTAETEVLDAEPVDEDQAADELQVRPEPSAPAIPEHPGRIPPALRRSAQVTGRIAVAGARGTARAGRAARPHAARAGKAGARHGVYLFGGTWDMVSESYKRATHRDIDEGIRAARRDGDHGTAAQLLQHKIAHRKVLLERWQVFGKFLIRAPIGIGLIAGTTLLITFVSSVVGLFQQGTDGFASTWSDFGNAVVTGWDWASWAATTLVPGAAVLGLLGVVLSGYNGRRTRQDAPEWMKATADNGDAREVIPDEGAILSALRNLGIAKLDEAFKKGWASSDSPTKVFEEGTVRDGRGYRTQIRLPQGVDVDTVNGKKKLLAHNLVRFPVEVWPTEPKDKPGVMDLWVADQGVLTGSVGPWPWLAELESAVADYFTGVPVGKDIRGDVVWSNLFEANFALAGIMGSGKSTLALEIAAGASLDPLVDIDVFVLAENADFEPMSPRLSTLLTGPGDEIVRAASGKLSELWDELEIRGQALKEHGERKNSRKLAEKDARLRPKLLVIDECQNLFLHKKLGEQAAVLSKKLINTARKYGVTVLFLTPEASTASLPRQVMAVISNKACFAIGDQQSNDAVLGTGSYKTGISATGLEPKTSEGPGDVGTSMTKGFKAKPSLLRTFYINETELARVTDRAMALREEAGITTESTPQAAVEDTPQKRDLLEDLAQVLGAERVPAPDAAALLRDLAPNHPDYQNLNGKKLASLLAEDGVKVVTTNNRPALDPLSVRQAVARRATADLDTDDDEDEVS